MATEAPIRIPLEAIDSSHIGAYGYDLERKILAVQFKGSGTIYHYSTFPLEQASEFGAAESKGRFYSANVKGKYPGRRMTGPCPECNDEGWIGDTCTDCGCAVYTEVPWKDGANGAV